MKACPFCAEAIQDAAVVCKHCGREITAPSAATTLAAHVTTRRGPRVRPAFAIAAGLVLVCGAALAGAASAGALGERASDRASAPPPATDTAASAAATSPDAGGTAAVVTREAPPEPEVLDLVDEDAAEIGPERWLHFAFSVAADAPACRLRGRVLALAGANRDVEVYALSADDYLNWRNGGAPPYTALFSGPRQTATTLDVELPAAGEYHLVVSNRFSVATAKTVQARARRLRGRRRLTRGGAGASDFAAACACCPAYA